MYNDEMLRQQIKEILKDIKENEEFAIFTKVANENVDISTLNEEIKMTENEIKELESSRKRYQEANHFIEG